MCSLRHVIVFNETKHFMKHIPTEVERHCGKVRHKNEEYLCNVNTDVCAVVLV